MTAPKSLQRFQAKIADIDRDSDGCWFVGLTHGWYCPDTETHIISDMRLSDVVGKLRGVIRCSPETCDMKFCGGAE